MNDYDGLLRADIARLEAECDAQAAEIERLRDILQDRNETVRAQNIAYARIESRLADARAEIERLRAELEETLIRMNDDGVEADAAESRLATAVGLLTDLIPIEFSMQQGWFARRAAFLGAAPAQPAAPARTEAETVECGPCALRGRECDNGDHCNECGNRMDGETAAPSDVCHDCWHSAKARTEAEQAVLDALSAVRTEKLHRWMGAMGEVCRAELARRGSR